MVLLAAGFALSLAQLASAAPPTNHAPPTIADDGTPAVGETLTASPGSWSPAPSSTSLQWLRCNTEGAACAPIPGATNTTYLLAAADVGHRIRVRETATFDMNPNPVSASADSDPTAVVAFAVTRPSAGFTFSPSAPVPGQTIVFSSRSTPSPGNQIIGYGWEFDGDGDYNDASSATVNRSYGAPGPKAVGLKVTETGGGFDIVTRLVFVNAPPSAGFTVSPAGPFVGAPTEFVSTSFDPDGPTPPDSLTWDLDNDGAFDDATGFTARRSFATAGSYTVRLRVRDASGAIDIESRTLSVRAVTTPLELMSPFPIVRLAGRVTRRGARLTLLQVRNAPRGARVAVRCKGRRCPYKRASKRVRRRKVRFKALERWLPGGTVIGVRVTKRDKIGKYTRFRIRRGKVPARKDLCLIPRYRKPKRCPGV